MFTPFLREHQSYSSCDAIGAIPGSIPQSVDYSIDDRILGYRLQNLSSRAVRGPDPAVAVSARASRR